MMKLKRIIEKVLITSLLFILCASFYAFGANEVIGFIDYENYDIPVMNYSDFDTSEIIGIENITYPLGFNFSEFVNPSSTIQYIYFDAAQTIGLAYKYRNSSCTDVTIKCPNTSMSYTGIWNSTGSVWSYMYSNLVYFDDTKRISQLSTRVKLSNGNYVFQPQITGYSYDVPMDKIPDWNPIEGEGGESPVYGGIASEYFPYESLYLEFLIPDDWDISSTSANGNLFDFLETAFNHVVMSMDAMLHMINYYVYVIQQDLNGIGTYGLWSLTPSLDGESYTRTVTQSSVGIRTVILNRIEYIADVFDFYFGRIYAWFYPLDSTSPFYWRYYNTSTEQQESIGLAGLLYNISWYLGQLYTLTAQNAALDNMDEAIDDVTDTFTSVEQAEQAVVQSVTSSIQSFNPDVSELGAFRALSWCASYLQQIYVSLGAYGNVITIGLLLGVCSQLIGFVRYH